MLMVFWPNGVNVNGVLLRSETSAGNLNFYKGIEGFLESFPQAIYQISISLRSAGKIGMNTFNAHFISNHKSNKYLKDFLFILCFYPICINFQVPINSFPS